MTRLTALFCAILLGATGGTVFAADDNALRQHAYDQTLALEQRLDAIRSLYGYAPDAKFSRTVCIWDIVGRNGPVFTAAEDQRIRLLGYGVDVKLVPYTSETVLVEDLKSARCDAALMSGLRARLFNRFTGTVDAVGGLPTDEHMRVLLQVLASPKLADQMVSNEYITMGIAPAGGAPLAPRSTMASPGARKRPPSENESGVMLTMPITRGRVRSMR